MYCPKCKYEYIEGFTKCSDCNIDLVEKLDSSTLVVFKDGPIYADYSHRIAANVIDNLIILIFCSPLLIVLYYQANRISEIYFLVMVFLIPILCILIYLFYFAIFETKKKATPGKSIFKISVVSNNGDNLTFLKAIFRAFIKYIFMNYLLILCIILLFIQQKHLLHDIITGTSVINNGQEENLKVDNTKE